jgi:hypothetical protein
VEKSPVEAGLRVSANILERALNPPQDGYSATVSPQPKRERFDDRTVRFSCQNNLVFSHFFWCVRLAKTPSQAMIRLAYLALYVRTLRWIRNLARSFDRGHMICTRKEHGEVDWKDD